MASKIELELRFDDQECRLMEFKVKVAPTVKVVYLGAWACTTGAATPPGYMFGS